jgi:hypothetical protein
MRLYKNAMSSWQAHFQDGITSDMIISMILKLLIGKENVANVRKGSDIL